jgi:hypothetical protein
MLGSQMDEQFCLSKNMQYDTGVTPIYIPIPSLVLAVKHGIPLPFFNLWVLP